MSWDIRPAVREDTPLIIGIAGPTKSGKTFSAHRLARGLAPNGKIVMLNAEGKRGHQYADTFTYLACDIVSPYTPERYAEALQAIATVRPDVLIIDSASHMHDGPGGMLEYHEAELDRMGKTDQKSRERSTWTAWIRPKAAENRFIYTMLELRCSVILCFRAKEKLKILPGREPIDLGWQPIAADRVAFETIFTLMLPPHCKGVPDLDISDMREPFDAMVPKGQPIDERLGKQLAAWARGGSTSAPVVAQSEPVNGHASGALDEQVSARDKLLAGITEKQEALGLGPKVKAAQWQTHVGSADAASASVDKLQALDDALTARCKAERR